MEGNRRFLLIAIVIFVVLAVVAVVVYVTISNQPQTAVITAPTVAPPPAQTAIIPPPNPLPPTSFPVKAVTPPTPITPLVTNNSCGNACNTNADCGSNQVCGDSKCLLAACAHDSTLCIGGDLCTLVAGSANPTNASTPTPLTNPDSSPVIVPPTVVATNPSSGNQTKVSNLQKLPKTGLFDDINSWLLIGVVLLIIGIVVIRTGLYVELFELIGGLYLLAEFSETEKQKLLLKLAANEQKIPDKQKRKKPTINKNIRYNFEKEFEKNT